MTKATAVVAFVVSHFPAEVALFLCIELSGINWQNSRCLFRNGEGRWQRFGLVGFWHLESIRLPSRGKAITLCRQCSQAAASPKNL